MTDATARRIQGASAIIGQFQLALSAYDHRIVKGYANIVVDADVVRDAVTLLQEMAATSDNSGHAEPAQNSQTKPSSDIRADK